MSAAEDSAHAAWDAGDLRAAFLLFREAAAQREPGAMLDLAYFHDQGLGTPRSKHDAMHWYRQAGRTDAGSAYSNVAILHRERRNARAMLKWFVWSARRGDGDSLVEVALCHRDGLGTPRWPARAIASARGAVRSSHITAAGRDEAREMLRALTSASVSRNIAEVRDRRRVRMMLSRIRPNPT